MRLTQRQQIQLVLLVIMMLIGMARGCKKNTSQSAPSSGDRSTSSRSSGGQRATRSRRGSSGTNDSSLNLALGNPTDATTSDHDNYLIERPQYCMSYNASKGHPNWVSWHLSAGDLGSVERNNKFSPDTSLPDGVYQVTTRDYVGSGFDRGHLCPSADRTATPEDNEATFLLSNIMPQAPGNNQGPWKLLEDYCRDLAKQGEELYIIAGTNGDHGKIGHGKISVPVSTWKAVLIIPEQDGDDLARIDGRARVIAIDIPNKEKVRQDDWKKFRVSVADIERETGYHLFSNLPQNVQSQLKSKVDNE